MSAILLVIGLWARASVSESPVFRQALADATGTADPVGAAPSRALLLTTFGAGAAFAFQVGMATFAQT
ncbi:hypothetical protein Aph02nite_65810 [Actinoplanes philippinensis]|uniref:MFS transporter n=1 Tax=Actinoplanes philippinensis TaxID=35752 RepID=A0A1I2L1M1_9ACTN|nr:hypothetical protein [Actinoplanes philippinensis]GIE80631.1 hypothetical protein Aph02nite_65810 [Actinoplanes philippinensis]SFF73222.1 hypothetical protein SAMN05421541_119162 [Actinoplanes philippinensis]